MLWKLVVLSWRGKCLHSSESWNGWLVKDEKEVEGCQSPGLYLNLLCHAQMGISCWLTWMPIATGCGRCLCTMIEGLQRFPAWGRPPPQSLMSCPCAARTPRAFSSRRFPPVCIRLDVAGIWDAHLSRLCSVWSAFSRPPVILGIPPKCLVAVVFVSLLVVLVN